MLPFLFPWTLSSTTLAILAYAGATIFAWLLAWFFAGSGGVRANPLRAASIFGVVAGVGAILIATRLTPIEPQPLPLHTYGLMIALAFISAIYLGGRAAERSATVDGAAFFQPGAPSLAAAAREAKSKGQELGPIVGRKAREHILDIGFWVFVGAMVGSRVLFIVVNWGGPDGYGADPMRIFQIWVGGFVFYGGFIGAALAALVYCRSHRIDFRGLADIGAPLVALGHFFGRMGCMSAGCCWGKVCEDPGFALGAHFPPGSMAYGSMVMDPAYSQYILEHGYTPALHPTQLYEGMGELALFFLLTWWAREKRFQGQILALWLMLYALLRLSIETFRGDFGRGMLLRWPEADPVLLSTSQTVGIGMFVVGAILYLRWRPKAEPGGEVGLEAQVEAA